MIVVDESEFPVVSMVFRDELTRDDWDQFTSLMQKYCDADNRVGLAIRVAKLPVPELAVLKVMGKWVNANKELMGRHVLATGISIPSAVLRGALKFVNSVAPAPAEQAVFKDWEEAQAWVRSRVPAAQARGATAPR